MAVSAHHMNSGVLLILPVFNHLLGLIERKHHLGLFATFRRPSLWSFAVPSWLNKIPRFIFLGLSSIDIAFYRIALNLGRIPWTLMFMFKLLFMNKHL